MADGASAVPRRIFLTESFDPQGQRILLTYDAKPRLISMTDALDQVTTLAYEYAEDELKVTKVTDPFGRAARFDYDASKRLSKITDVIGIKSQFHYGGGAFVSQLTTPYGMTTFAAGLRSRRLRPSLRSMGAGHGSAWFSRSGSRSSAMGRAPNCR